MFQELFVFAAERKELSGLNMIPSPEFRRAYSPTLLCVFAAERKELSGLNIFPSPEFRRAYSPTLWCVFAAERKELSGLNVFPSPEFRRAFLIQIHQPGESRNLLLQFWLICTTNMKFYIAHLKLLLIVNL